MAGAPYKILATEQNFAEAVVAASSRQPVLVDFWAPWCGPCRTLMPMLDRIADDYGGRFTLAKLNTDEEQRIAGHSSHQLNSFFHSLRCPGHVPSGKLNSRPG